MIPVQLAKTPELSRLKRNCYVAEALYWRKVGNKRMENHYRHMASIERLNKFEFLGDELPF